MTRVDGRTPDQLRPITIQPGFMKWAEGSTLIEVGDTKVICTATVEDRVPPFLRGNGQGWVTAEYAMLPRSTQSRSAREAARGRLGGRTHEIQRLVGRALRSVVDLSQLGERTIWIDCDVIQADGGTRTAALTGAFVALVWALEGIRCQTNRKQLPVTDYLAAVSVGIVDGQPLLDLCYAEDVRAQVDMNLAATDAGALVEVQVTGEERPLSRSQFNELLDLGLAGIDQLVLLQAQALPDGAESRFIKERKRARVRARVDE